MLPIGSMYLLTHIILVWLVKLTEPSKLLPHIYTIESVTRRSDGYMAKLEKNSKTCNQNLTMQYTQIYDTEMHD